jgi:hypothetical protein
MPGAGGFQLFARSLVPISSCDGCQEQPWSPRTVWQHCSDATYPAANNAVWQLVDAGVRRNRAFEAADIITAFADVHRQLASPEGDIRTSEPVRRVPPRR